MTEALLNNELISARETLLNNEGFVNNGSKVESPKHLKALT